MVSHAELAHSAPLSQPAAFSPPLLNAPDHLGKKNPCQLLLQAQSQSQPQSQIPVQQPSDSQRASSVSVGSSLTQQKPLGTVSGSAGQAPTEVITEVWSCIFILLLTRLSSSSPFLVCPLRCSKCKLVLKVVSVMRCVLFSLFICLFSVGASLGETYWRTGL